MDDQDSSPLLESDEEFPQSERKCCAPGATAYRLLALFYMCLLGFGSSFCYDNPGALQDIFIKDISLSATEFSYLYSLYSWPNVVLCFIGGFLIDRVLGIKLGAVIYSLIIVIGHVIFALGALANSFLVMCLGRLIFGIGGESLAVAQNYYAVLWFKGKELNMVFGLQLSISRVGSAVNFMVVGHIYSFLLHYFSGYTCLGVTLFITGITVLISFISALCLSCMTREQDREPVPRSSTAKEEEEVVRLTDIRHFDLSFWLVCFICVVYYVAIFPYIAMGKVFFMEKYGLSSADANMITSLLYVLSFIASPIFGLLVDKVGWNMAWVTIAILTTLGAHALLAFTFVSPLICQVLLGLGYSLLASALWPLVALIIPERHLGSAYGIAQAVQNFGLAMATMVAGVIVDKGGYFMLEMFFLFSLFASLVAAVLMWAYDVSTTGVLNMTAAQREAHSLLIDEDDGIGKARSGSIQQVSAYNVVEPRSHYNIRNRYLSRLGGPYTIPTQQTSPEVLAYRRFR